MYPPPPPLFGMSRFVDVLIAVSMQLSCFGGFPGDAFAFLLSAAEMSDAPLREKETYYFCH